MTCPTVQRELREDFADHAREFESVAAATTGEDYILVLRMAIENEMTVGRIGIHAHATSQQPPARAGNTTTDSGGDCLGFAGANAAIELIRIGRLGWKMVGAFESAVIVNRKTVMQPAGGI